MRSLLLSAIILLSTLDMSFGGGTMVGVGIDGEKNWAEALTNKHNELKAGSKVILRSKRGQYIRGSVVEAPQMEVSAKKLLIESVLDTSESHAKGGGFDTTGSASFYKSDSESAWVNRVSGFYASESMRVNIEEGIELVGAVIDGPDGHTHIESDTFCYRDIAEFENSKSMGLGLGFIWDKENIAYGSAIPGAVDYDYHHDAFEGKTRATVAGDPSFESTGVNTDRNAVQQRWQTKHKHVRVFLPIADVKEIWEDVFGGRGDNDLDIDEARQDFFGWKNNTLI